MTTGFTGFMEIAEVAHRKMPYFRFLRVRSNVCFCFTTALFDYHWTQILCEVEEQATCMPMKKKKKKEGGKKKKKCFIWPLVRNKY